MGAGVGGFPGAMGMQSEVMASQYGVPMGAGAGMGGNLSGRDEYGHYAQPFEDRKGEDL